MASGKGQYTVIMDRRTTGTAPDPAIPCIDDRSLLKIDTLVLTDNMDPLTMQFRVLRFPYEIAQD